jgi:hypothetical protein
MTWQRWLASTVCVVLALGTFWYGVYHIKGTWGMALVLGVFIAAAAWLVNTVDLLFGRWIRQGRPHVGRLPSYPVRPSYPEEARCIRRVIIEEIHLD